jgi:hypothetical protein
VQLTDAHVLTCHVSSCSYNCADECCAPAISVGDDHPRCDMYTTREVRLAEHSGRVTKCHVCDCHFHEIDECHAPGVTLGAHLDHADCMTYRV